MERKRGPRNWAKSISVRYTYSETSNLKHACRVESIFRSRKPIIATGRFNSVGISEMNSGETEWNSRFLIAVLSIRWTGLDARILIASTGGDIDCITAANDTYSSIACRHFTYKLNRETDVHGRLRFLFWQSLTLGWFMFGLHF